MGSQSFAIELVERKGEEFEALGQVDFRGSVFAAVQDPNKGLPGPVTPT